MMFNSQKVLSTIFVILFIITVSELFYVFYYQPSISKKTPLPIPIPSVSVKSNNVVRLPFVSDKKSAFQSGDQVKEIISYADGFIIGSAIIKIIEDTKNKKEMIEKFLNFVENIRFNLK